MAQEVEVCCCMVELSPPVWFQLPNTQKKGVTWHLHCTSTSEVSVYFVPFTAMYNGGKKRVREKKLYPYQFKPPEYIFFEVGLVY